MSIPHASRTRPAILSLVLFVWCLRAFAFPPLFDRFEHHVGKLAEAVRPGERIAVGRIAEQPSGDLNGLGNLWRDRVQAALIAAGRKPVPRKDLVRLIGDAETFDTRAEEPIWRRAGVQLLVIGDYRLVWADGEPEFTLQLKLLRQADLEVAAVETWQVDAPPDWARLRADVLGNLRHPRSEHVTGPGAGPRLSARLEPQPACYPDGGHMRIQVDTEPGVHLYILTLDEAMRHAWRLFPNEYLHNAAQPSGNLEFPPRALWEEGLSQFSRSGRLERESFRVIASHRPLDFGFLPVPTAIDTPGGDWARVQRILKSQPGWSQVPLVYFVGPECGP